MSKFIVITMSDGERMAIRKDLVTFVTENGSKEDPTRVWIKKDEYDEEAYNCCNTLEEVLAKLEE